jgi:EgtB-related family protein
MSDARRLSGQDLAHALLASRARTLQLVDDLSDEQWRMPRQPGVNPTAWELSHIAWFGEFWILRGPHHVGADGFMHAERPARIAGPDALFDSARLAHAQRWEVPLPSRREAYARLQAQLEACLEALPDGDDDAALYFHRLALLHEDMHGEAFVWTRSTLGQPAPRGLEPPRLAPSRPPLRFDAARVQLGRARGEAGFAFDNEQPGKTTELAAFEIDAQPLRNADYLHYVEAGGTPPAAWRRTSEGWQQRWFDRWLPLDPDGPVMHLGAHEAEACSRWLGRRLPTAAEWEHAARSGRMAWGMSVWEWTADPFEPYPGFEPGPYKDYSAPWFGDHRELRGGAFATDARLLDPGYRNFFRPERTDVFAGFRTALTL